VASYEADATAPAISDLTAAPGADGTATITWTTDEPATSRVDYGTSPDALNLNATEPGSTTSHSVKLTGLQLGTTYHYRVTSEDAAGNPATSPPNSQAPASFKTPDAGFTDTTTTDFGAGTPGADTYISQIANGEIILKPAVGEEFSGTSLPSGWTGTPWGAGGTATVTDGQLTVDGARAGTDALYGPGRSLEFSGTFASALNQHVGFGVDYNGPPWAMFSTGSGSQAVALYARTNNGSTNTDTPISGVLPTEKHRYRIEWDGSSVVYYVDGTEVARHAIGISAQMRPLASDFNVGGGTLSIDGLRMGPYSSSGAFTSRVFDSGKDATDWLGLTATTQKPAATNVTFETRSGETATPDGTWSGWEQVASDGSIASPNGRYVQYRANLSTSDPSVSPTVEDVTLGYRVDEEVPADPSKPDLASESDSGIANDDDVTNDTTPTFAGTAEAGSTVRILVDGVEKGRGTATGGNYSITTDELSPGTLSVTAKATDAAGNESAESAALSVTLDTGSPSVDSVRPAANATGVATGANIEASFSEEMDPFTFGVNSFRLVEQGGSSSITASVAYDAPSRTATLDPNADLKANTTYTATLTTDVKDKAGNALASAQSWSFTTTQVADTAQPTVEERSPLPKATNVSRDANVTVTFSEAMDPSTIDSSNIRLVRKADGARVAASVSYDAASRTATVDPGALLEANTVYKVTVSTRVTDLAGNPMASVVAWNFTTGA
jgi:hypothetical protein